MYLLAQLLTRHHHVQILLGIAARPKKTSQLRRWFNISHWTLGRLTLTLAIANIFIGMYLSSVAYKNIIAQAVVLGGLLIIYMLKQDIDYLRIRVTPAEEEKLLGEAYAQGMLLSAVLTCCHFGSNSCSAACVCSPYVCARLFNKYLPSQVSNIAVRWQADSTVACCATAQSLYNMCVIICCCASSCSDVSLLAGKGKGQNGFIRSSDQVADSARGAVPSQVDGQQTVI